MHVHKPKAPHGLRELVAEIGVIVLGVAIALAGEQAVEWLHWRAVVAETRQALNRELAFDFGVAQARIDQAPCMARRLAELRTVFALHAAGRPLGLKRPVGQPIFPHIRTAVWATAVADQSAAHMPIDLKLRYAAVYETMDWLGEKTGEESDAWTRLAQLDDSAAMGEADWTGLRQAAARAGALAEKVEDPIMPYAGKGAASQFLDRARGLGVTPEPFRLPGPAQARLQARAQNFCAPLV